MQKLPEMRITKRTNTEQERQAKNEAQKKRDTKNVLTRVVLTIPAKIYNYIDLNWLICLYLYLEQMLNHCINPRCKTKIRCIWISEAQAQILTCSMDLDAF